MASPPQKPSESFVMPAHLTLPSRPVAHAGNIVSGDRWRITVLDAGLLRLQWSPSGRFEDRASQAVLNRDFEPVDFVVRENERVLEVITDRLHLSYDRGPFSTHGLSAQARGGVSSYHSNWRFGSQGEANLGGTARTLDHVDGRVQLEDGILAQHGVACYDDSHTVLLEENGWFAEREPGSLDLYLFVYGRDYRQALATFYRLTGDQPLLPRWALGNWWSRYHPYSGQEYLALMDRFEAERLPFSVAVIDMEWHLVEIPTEYGSGWTGYTWNRSLFPDPAATLADLHRRGMKVTLNVHPADGVRAHEDAYPGVAEAMGLDPAQRLPVAFDPTDPRFLRAYLELVHHPLEADGVDFWWLDWQQGRHSRVAGLDPLWLLNHLHFLDSGRPGGPLGARPLTFSRYAGVGSHRYPVGFSGDTVVSWASLAFQPEFTARASNVGYGWWSHDVGGHMFGTKDDELATRWLQLGVFSPLLRLHSTRDIFNSKEPWRFDERSRTVMGRFLRLRHQLLPYLATMAHRAHFGRQPLVQPMYYDHPWDDDAYRVDNQFMFGSTLLVAPIVRPADHSTGLARVDVWLPPAGTARTRPDEDPPGKDAGQVTGEWVDLFTGTVYTGNRWVPMFRPLEQLPVLARTGSLLPLVPEDDVSSATGVPSRLELWVVAGADGSFDLIEDADDDAWARTPLSYRHGPRHATLRLGAVEGERTTVGEHRHWSLVLVGPSAPGDVDEVRLGEGSLPVTAGPVPGSLRVDLGRLASDTEHTVHLSGRLEPGGADPLTAIFDLLDRARIAFADKAAIWRTVNENSPAVAALSLSALGLDEPVRLAVSELLLARA